MQLEEMFSHAENTLLKVLSETLALLFWEDDAADRKSQSKNPATAQSKVAAPGKAVVSRGQILWGVCHNLANVPKVI